MKTTHSTTSKGSLPQDAKPISRVGEDEYQPEYSEVTIPSGKDLTNPSQIINLQRSIGNRAVMRMLSKSATGEEELAKSALPQMYSPLHKSATGEEELEKGAPTSTSKDEEGEAHGSGCGCSLCKGSGKIMRHIDDTSTSNNKVSPAHTATTEVVEHRSDTMPDKAIQEQLMKATITVTDGAPPSIGLGGDYGLTFPESVAAEISAVKSGSNWKPVVKKLTGHYSLQASLLSGQSEITGPSGNTSSTNWKQQVKNLKLIGEDVGNPWYMLQAVIKHEQVHATRFQPALDNVSATIISALEAVTVPDATGKTEDQAIKDIEADGTYKSELKKAQATWLTEILTLVAGDHASGGPTETAERTVVDPMRDEICKHAAKEKWGTSPHC